MLRLLDNLPSSIKRPRSVRPVQMPRQVQLVDYNPWPNPPRLRGAKAQGLQYQARVTKLFEEYCDSDKYGPNWVTLPGPWFSYIDEAGQKRHAQPDIVLINFTQARIVIVEVKLTYCCEAWWQLNTLYLPLINKAFPPWLWDTGLLAVAHNVPLVNTPTPGRYVRNWTQARSDLGDIGIMRLPKTSLPRVK